MKSDTGRDALVAPLLIFDALARGRSDLSGSDQLAAVALRSLDQRGLERATSSQLANLCRSCGTLQPRTFLLQVDQNTNMQPNIFFQKRNAI